MRKSILFLIAWWLTGLPVFAQGLLPDDDTGTSRALVVGIADYENDSIDLYFASRDAEIFALFLTTEMGGQLDADKIILLTDSLATKGAIRMGLRWLLKESQAGDRAIVYFSGHGDVERETTAKRGYLLAYDTPPNNYPDNAIQVDFLNDVLNTLTAKGVQTLLVTDACRSGNLAGQDAKGTMLANQALLETGADVTKLLSCAPAEESIESPNFGGGRGVFSYFLIKGLTGEADRNKDQVVDVGEIDLYLKINIPPAVAPDSQSPEIRASNKTLKLAELERVDTLIVAMNEQPHASTGMAGLVRGLKKGGTEDTNPSTEELIRRFDLAIGNGQLLSPVSRSALAYFEKLEKKMGPEAVEPFRMRLAAALQDEAQAAINRYLVADSLELARQTMIAETFIYDQYPKYLATAAELVGETDWLYRSLMAKSYFFEAVNQRLKGLIDNQAQSGARKALDLLDKTLPELEDAAYVHFEMGLSHYLLGQVEEAEAHYRTATELAPTWPLPYARLSALYRETGRADQMLAMSAMAVETDPGFFGGYIEKGKALEALGDLLMAEVNYRQALWLNMDSYIPFEQLGFLYLKTGQFALADEMLYESDLRKGLQVVEPEDLRIDLPDSDSDGDGNVDIYDLEFFDEDLYLQLIRINPNDIDSYLALAYYYLEGNRLEEAETMFRHVIALQPRHLDANVNLFQLMLRKHNLAAAELFLDVLDGISPLEFIPQRLKTYEAWDRYQAREPLHRKLGQTYDLHGFYQAENRWTNLRWLASEQFVKRELSLGILKIEVEFMGKEDIHPADYALYKGLLEIGISGYVDLESERALSTDRALEAFWEVLQEPYPAEAQVRHWISEQFAEESASVRISYGPYREEVKYHEAELEQTDLARKLRPDDMDLLFDHIRALIDFRKYEEALHLLDSLETDRLLDMEWTVELARLRVLSGKRSEAQEMLDHVRYAYISDDELPDAWHHAQGLSDQLAGEHLKASEQFRTILTRNYGDADHYYQQSRSLAAAGELEQALAVLEGAWINGFQYDRVFKYDPHLRVLKEWSRFEEWKTGHGIDWDRYRQATRYK
jgi:tetratricopeptide (TPR) repeat protein